MSGEAVDAAHAEVILSVLRAPAERRPEVLADAVVEFGPDLVDSLRRVVAGSAAAGFRAADQGLLAGLTAQAGAVLSAWLTGERVTHRADEQERRVRVTRRLADRDPDDTVLARLAVDAVLRLPAGHPERDLEFARDALLRQVERGRGSADHLDDLLVATFYLLHHDLLSVQESARVIEEALAVAAAGRARSR